MQNNAKRSEEGKGIKLSAGKTSKIHHVICSLRKVISENNERKYKNLERKGIFRNTYLIHTKENKKGAKRSNNKNTERPNKKMKSKMTHMNPNISAIELNVHGLSSTNKSSRFFRTEKQKLTSIFAY